MTIVCFDGRNIAKLDKISIALLLILLYFLFSFDFKGLKLQKSGGGQIFVGAKKPPEWRCIIKKKTALGRFGIVMSGKEAKKKTEGGSRREYGCVFSFLHKCGRRLKRVVRGLFGVA